MILSKFLEGDKSLECILNQ